MSALALDRPFALLACALAVLPLLPRALPALSFSHLAFLPRDRLGTRLERGMRGLAALAIAAAGLGLSGPHLAAASVPRSVRGAEVSIVLDRSASMDEVIGSPAEHGGGEVATGTSRSDAVRAALSRWVDARPDDRYAVTVFSTAPIPVLPLTDDLEAVRASL
jgi:mxaC protein